MPRAFCVQSREIRTGVNAAAKALKTCKVYFRQPEIWGLGTPKRGPQGSSVPPCAGEGAKYYLAFCRGDPGRPKASGATSKRCSLSCRSGTERRHLGVA